MGEELQVIGPRSGSAPLVIPITDLNEVDVSSVFAHFDGSGASGNWYAAVTVKSQSGAVLWRGFPETTLAAGDTADVSFAPFRRRVVTSGTASYDQTILATPTLLYYYLCGEASGNLADSVSGLDLLPVGAPGYGAAGPIPPATAVSANGTANYWAVTNPGADAAFGNVHAFTIEGFLYVDASASANDPMFSIHAGGTQIDLGTTFGSKRLSLQRGATQTPATATQAISTGTWHHVAGTYDGSNLRCYLDGSLIGGPTADIVNLGSMAGGTQAIAARGAPTFSAYLTGRAANVAVYSSALSGPTIMLHYLTWLGLV